MPGRRASMEMPDAQIAAHVQPLLAALRSQIRTDIREELERLFQGTKDTLKAEARYAGDVASAQRAENPISRPSAHSLPEGGAGKPKLSASMARASMARASMARTTIRRTLHADDSPAGDNHTGGSADRYHLASKYGVDAMLKLKEKQKKDFKAQTTRGRNSGQYTRLLVQDAHTSGDDSTAGEDEVKRVSIAALVEPIVTSWKFDVFSAVAVLLNALTIGFETEYQCRHFGEPLPEFFWHINLFIGVIFGIEVFLKLCAYRGIFFCGESWHWNLFDLSLVLEMAAQSSGLLGANLNVIGFLRLARLARIGRLFNLVEEMQTITLYVASAVDNMFWAILVLLVLLYSAAVAFTQLVLLNMDSANAGDMDDLLYWFGTVSRTSLTLFECIASGVSWDAVAQPLIVHISPFAALGLCTFIAFVVFAILNVVTGVVLNTATKFARAEEDKLTANNICNAFNLDIDNLSREIDCDEFAACLLDKEMQAYFETIDVDTGDASTLFELVDIDNNGGVNAVELISSLMHLRGSAKAKHLAIVAQDTRRILEWTQNYRHHAEEIGSLRDRLLALERTQLSSPSFSPRPDGNALERAQISSPSFSPRADRHPQERGQHASPSPSPRAYGGREATTIP